MPTQIASVPGLLMARSPESCLMEIGGVVASASRQTVLELVQALPELRAMRDSSLGIACAVQLPPGSDWTSIGYWREKDLLVLNLRGVCWYPTLEQLENFVANAALPFLGAEATQNLLPAGA